MVVRSVNETDSLRVEANQNGELKGELKGKVPIIALLFANGRIAYNVSMTL